MRRLAFLPLLLLGACATDQNMTLSPAVAPVVATAEYPIDLASGPAGLAMGEDARLSGWLEAMQVGPGDRLGVMPGLAGRDVAAVAARFGVKVTDAAPAGPDGAVRVTLRRTTASVPGCPNWADEQKAQDAAATSRNFGCASLANFAAMLADPNDLLHGRVGDGGDPRVSLRAIQMWREAKPSGAGGLKAESAAGGGK